MIDLYSDMCIRLYYCLVQVDYDIETYNVMGQQTNTQTTNDKEQTVKNFKVRKYHGNTKNEKKTTKC